MNISDFPCDKTIALDAVGSWPAAGHFGCRKQFAAVVAAWYAGRPLLVRGEPGIGKSQLAIAVAQSLGWQLISVGIQPQMRYQDLLWEFDAVARLAQAQILGASYKLSDMGEEGESKLDQKLDMQRFIQPKALWWAFRPKSARTHALKSKCTEQFELIDTPKEPKKTVLLIDEIDKADANLPNGLLEVLGNGDLSLPVPVDDEAPRKPLTIITSNDERQLPQAFLRRCLVLDLSLPETQEECIAHLLSVAKSHDKVPNSLISEVPETIKELVATQLIQTRQDHAETIKPPGVAEYLDMLRVLGGMGEAKQMEALFHELKSLVLEKHHQRGV